MLNILKFRIKIPVIKQFHFKFIQYCANGVKLNRKEIFDVCLYLSLFNRIF